MRLSTLDSRPLNLFTKSLSNEEDEEWQTTIPRGFNPSSLDTLHSDTLPYNNQPMLSYTQIQRNIRFIYVSQVYAYCTFIHVRFPCSVFMYVYVLYPQSQIFQVILLHSSYRSHTCSIHRVCIVQSNLHTLKTGV